MPIQTVVQSVEVVAQGGVLELSTDDGSTYAIIPGVAAIPRVGVEGSFVEVTSIDQITKRFVAGIKTPPEWELAFNRVGDNAVQDALIAAAVASDTVKMQVTYQSGDIAVVDLVLNGYYADEVGQGDAVQMFGVKGQQDGDAVFSKVA